MVDQSGVNGDVPGQADDTEYLFGVLHSRDNVLSSPKVRSDNQTSSRENTEPWSQPPIFRDLLS